MLFAVDLLMPMTMFEIINLWSSGQIDHPPNTKKPTADT